VRLRDAEQSRRGGEMTGKTGGRGGKTISQGFGNRCRMIEHRISTFAYFRSSSPPSSAGRRPFRLCGENSPFRGFSAGASPPASRQSALYFVCPWNSPLKNVEAVDGDTSAAFASSLLPTGARFRQLPSAYWWCFVSAAMSFNRPSPRSVLRLVPGAGVLV